MEHREYSTINISLGTIVKVIVTIILFGILFLLRDLVFVLLMSIVVASAVEPGTQWFMKRGIPRIFSVILIYLLVAACFIGAVFFLLLPLLGESSDFLKNFPVYFNYKTVSSTITNND